MRKQNFCASYYVLDRRSRPFVDCQCK
uniref:Uncharacterized protein n=1 Tax=Arundo donax TaxID=35708 RepID=A0A0A9G0C3_ARUDO